MKRSWLFWVPLGLFGLAFVLFLSGIVAPGDRNISSQMVGKPLPEFALRPATAGQPGVRTADFRDGRPKLLNIFASWCVPCIAEAPQLEELARAGATIHGVAIRDRPEDVAAFLERNGNPYQRIGADDLSEVQLEIGSSGVPETFVIDGKGRIVHQHIGDIRREDVPELLARLEGAS